MPWKTCVTQPWGCLCQMFMIFPRRRDFFVWREVLTHSLPEPIPSPTSASIGSGTSLPRYYREEVGKYFLTKHEEKNGENYQNQTISRLWMEINQMQRTKRCLKLKLFSHVRLFATPWTVAYQAPPSMGVSRQENWSGLPFPSLEDLPKEVCI